LDGTNSTGSPNGPVKLPHGELPPVLTQPPGHRPGAEPPVEPRGNKFLHSKGWLIGELTVLGLLLAIFLTIVVLLLFVGKAFIVHGESMMPTLHNGDRVFVSPYRYGRIPNRGDIVTLKGIQGAGGLLIKRVVAIGGDILTIENGDVIVNGRYVHRSTNRYVAQKTTQLVPDNTIFVMGDNEHTSFDSRTFGFVPYTNIVGRAMVVFWPPGDLKKL